MEVTIDGVDIQQLAEDAKSDPESMKKLLLAQELIESAFLHAWSDKFKNDPDLVPPPEKENTSKPDPEVEDMLLELSLFREHDINAPAVKFLRPSPFDWRVDEYLWAIKTGQYISIPQDDFAHRRYKEGTTIVCLNSSF